MSEAERTGNSPEPEPHEAQASDSRRKRWSGRARRIRNEAGLHLLRGAATAADGTIVTYGFLWLQAH